MLPSTFVGVLLFLWLVTPGFLFGVLAGRRRAAAATSAFHETAQVIVASVVFSGLGAALAALVVAILPARLSLRSLILDGRAYLGQHAGSAALFLLTQIVIACLLAWAADGLERRRTASRTGQPPPQLRTESAWNRLLGAHPPGASTHVWLRLTSGTEFRGRVLGFGHEIDVDERELVLTNPIEVRYPKQRWQSLGVWHHLALQGGDIEFLAVTHYADKEPGHV